MTTLSRKYFKLISMIVVISYHNHSKTCSSTNYDTLALILRRSCLYLMVIFNIHGKSCITNCLKIIKQITLSKVKLFSYSIPINGSPIYISQLFYFIILYGSSNCKTCIFRIIVLANLRT